MADKVKPVDWKTLEALHNTDLETLIEDLKEAEQALKDAQARKDAVRELIRETIGPVGTQPVLCGERRIAWVAPTKTFKLDQALLVKAGVTPLQLKKGLKEGEKVGYLDVKVVKGGGEVESE